MGRFFAAAALVVVLLPAHGVRTLQVQPVFFSMLFPQLIPQALLDAEAEALGEGTVAM